MEIDVISTLLKDFGFPVFVAIWLLYKDTKTQREHTEVLNEVKNAIEVLTMSLKKGE